MKHCSNCGAEMEESAPACPACGAIQDAQAAAPAEEAAPPAPQQYVQPYAQPLPQKKGKLPAPIPPMQPNYLTAARPSYYWGTSPRSYYGQAARSAYGGTQGASFAPAPPAGAKRRANVKSAAVAGLVFAILSMLLSSIGFSLGYSVDIVPFYVCGLLSAMFGLYGLIDSAVSLGLARRTKADGRGIAIAGLILSILGMIGGACMIYFYITMPPYLWFY